MFPQDLRLREKRDYEQVFKRGTWNRGKYFSIVSLPTPKGGKIGFLITKKVTKSSVERNAMKRRLRSAFRSVFAHLESSPLTRYHLVVVIHRRNAELSYGELEQEVTRVLNKIHDQDRV